LQPLKSKVAGVSSYATILTKGFWVVKKFNLAAILLYNEFTFFLTAMIFLIHHIRKIVLAINFLVALGIYFYVSSTFQTPSLQNIRLTQLLAFASVINLYLALIASPLYSALPNLALKPIHIRARRAIGVSAFFFALLHAYFAFFTQLGGFSGLFYLSSRYLIPITLSFTALVILSLMASTSFDFIVRKLGTRWKTLHRFVYLAAFLIVIHALMLGSHFVDLSQTIPKIFFAALAFLLVLEALRFDKYLTNKFPWFPKFGLFLILVTGVIVWSSSYLRPPGEGNTSLGIHAQHIQLAKQAQQGTIGQQQLPNLPGLTGDRTKRYTVNFDHPDKVSPKQPVELRFKVYDASSGNLVTLFQRPYEKFFHLIIVDSTLTHFEHIHPEREGTEFKITTSFPTESTYHLYADFQPTGAIDQQVAFTLTVGNPSDAKPTQQVDKTLTKTFGEYEVTLNTSGTLKASQMSLGEQKITFTIKKAGDKTPVTNLKPYLNSFGHLVMINQETYEYLHVHPYDLKAPPPDSNGGPNVEFLPIGIYGPFKSGVYRAFGQFNHNGELFVAYFTLKVEK
jgi:DMSO/TMAO reductase YedYZ heme-binding membrane subunit